MKLKLENALQRESFSSARDDGEYGEFHELSKAEGGGRGAP